MYSILPIFVYFRVFLCVLCIYGPSAGNKPDNDDDDYCNDDILPGSLKSTIYGIRYRSLVNAVKSWRTGKKNAALTSKLLTGTDRLNPCHHSILPKHFSPSLKDYYDYDNYYCS